MNPDPSKLRQQQQQTEQTAEAHLQQEGQVARQFSSVEEIIRFDAHQNPAPDVIAQRLTESLAREPKRPRSWWQRLFGRGT